MRSKTRVQKWGNSLAIRIPQPVAKDLGLAEGSQVQIASSGSSATIKPVRFRGKTLEELLRKVTPGNLYDEFDWGEPAGREIW